MEILRGLLKAVIVIAVVDALGSWFVGPGEFPRSITKPLLDPVYAPIRGMMGVRGVGGVDPSAFILVIAAQLLLSQLKPKTETGFKKR